MSAELEVSMFSNFDQFFFSVLPYVSIIVFLIVTIQRYRSQAFTYSSLSSQFLENKYHFWGMVPFHYGLLTVLGGHILGFLVPRSILAWNEHPLRLYILEITGLIGALLAFVGLVNIILRKATHSRPRVVTTKADWAIYALLTVQIVTGIGIAVLYGWGSSWFAASLSPYLWSVVTFSPDIDFVTPLPALVKAHIVTAYLIILFFPFTRLVHVLVVPNHYLWRKPQLVRWNWNRKTIRKQD
jgi:nitrate reductase gamma subunit